MPEGGTAAARRPFSNGVNAKHLLFLAAIFVIRKGLPVAMGSSSESHARNSEGGEHGEEEIPEYEVFHVDFEYVQLPFIISLWIFVSSLAKIGEC